MKYKMSILLFVSIQAFGATNENQSPRQNDVPHEELKGQPVASRKRRIRRSPAFFSAFPFSNGHSEQQQPPIKSPHEEAEVPNNGN